MNQSCAKSCWIFIRYKKWFFFLSIVRLSSKMALDYTSVYSSKCRLDYPFTNFARSCFIMIKLWEITHFMDYQRRFEDRDLISRWT